MQRVNVRIPSETLLLIQELSEKASTTKSEVIRVIISDYMKMYQINKLRKEGKDEKAK